MRGKKVTVGFLSIYTHRKSDTLPINQGKERDEWPLTCVLFAPNAPEQNPVEDIWLHAKTWVRKFGNRLSSFALVKWFFNFTIQSPVGATSRL